MPSTSDIFRIDDTVMVGFGSVHWIIDYIADTPTEVVAGVARTPVRLRSGLTQMKRAAYLDELTHWKPRLSTAEEVARENLVHEMIAEGMVERQAEVLSYRQGNREFMVEIKVLEVTE